MDLKKWSLQMFHPIDPILAPIYFCLYIGYSFDFFQVYAFVAPKIIGGKNAPSPVGELGMVEMTQALVLNDVCYEQVHVDFHVS